jgi:dethiobiotin synthase
MAKGFFITGSGTYVGKTHVSKLLLTGFSKLGYGVTYMKPVETGCNETLTSAANNTGWETSTGTDTAAALRFASRRAADLNLHSPYRFIPACSPHLAARGSDNKISVARIVSVYEDLKKCTTADITIVEGAGGLLVPINDDGQYVADVIKALSIPAILVVMPGLGTLNHTFMSLHTLERYGIPVAGVVVNNPQNIGRDFIYEDNVNMIRRHVAPLRCLDVNYTADLNADLGVSDKDNGGTPGESPLTEFCHGLTSSV